MKRQIQKDLTVKVAILEKVNFQLKEEFIGLEKIIDQLCSSISSWFLFPEFQKRPLIINLWGMTGVGKTSLINKLIDLLELRDIHYQFDLGELKGGKLNVINQLRDLAMVKHDRATVITFDEFQLARTIDESNKEILEPENRIIWKLLDSGKFEIDNTAAYVIQSFTHEIQALEYLIDKGVKAKNGIVVEELELFKTIKRKRIELRKQDRKNSFEERLISPDFYFMMLDCNLDGFNLIEDIESTFLSINEIETLELLKKLQNQYATPTKVDCSKALIFNIGNLNSLFPMSSDYSSDLSANLFYNQSMKIGLNEVKDNLKSLFRHEQVARLGNNHIIFPSINEEQFQQFIKSELKLIANQIKEKLGWQPTFHESFLQHLYQTSIIPSLGYRPLLTSIDTEVKALLSKITMTTISQKLKVDEVELTIVKNQLHAGYSLKSNELYYEILKESVKDESEEKTDEDVIVATHEAGHVLCGLILLGKIPSQVVTKSKERGHLGFVYHEDNSKLKEMDLIKLEIATLLGGRAAEELVFGALKVTSGAARDIEKATELASISIKNFGFGPFLGTYNNVRQYNTRIQNYDTEKAIEHLLQEGYRIALATLKSKDKWLKELSYKLLVHQNVNKEQILDIFDELRIDPKKFELTHSYSWKFLRFGKSNN